MRRVRNFYGTVDGLQRKYGFTVNELEGFIEQGILVPSRFNDRLNIKLYGYDYRELEELMA